MKPKLRAYILKIMLPKLSVNVMRVSCKNKNGFTNIAAEEEKEKLLEFTTILL